MTPPDITTEGEMLDIDALAAASREKAKAIYPFKYMGETWHARTAVPFGKLVATLSGDATLDGVLDAILCFLVEDERERFREAILASEDVTTQELSILSTALNEKAQAEVGNADT